ncbi:hypothetical protein MHU86_20802 [Fragilaria crotonensis]|nr:hypothetical protein MHU86_20802 [Fragilaria crotonensis]
MIEKDPGRPRINRLRIIHLFEADYNLFLKIMWGSRLVNRSVQLNLLNEGQHGSVPGRTTMDPVMLNQLTTDLCRVLKVNYARFDNDASACFDRIIVALGMMAARRCGMPVEAVRTHAKALELMQYMVKTIYGVSEESYKGTALEPLFGTGQGSGASPAVWLSLVVILLNTLERVVHERISFTSADGKIHHQRLVDAFVDDTAIGLTDTGERSLSELVAALASVAQTWEQLLHFSGGGLNLQKCSWYVMYWDWRQGRPGLREIKADDPTVQLYQGSGQPRSVSTIRRQQLHESSRILGVHQTPLGDFSDHITVLKAKADRFAGYIRSPRLTKSDLKVFHRSIYKPAMLYSLPAIAVDEEELEKIQSKIIPTIVQRLGFSSKLATAVRYGPVSMGGLDLLDLRTECGIEMIKYFRHEVYGNTKVGQLLLLQVQASQLESGLPHILLEEPDIHIPYLTPTWILSMRQFMSNHNVRITLTDTFIIPLQGRHDLYIMDLQRLKGYTLRQQQDLNLVRIHLQVSTLADLVDPSESRKIATWALEARRPIHFKGNTAWPRQVSVTSQQRRLWRRYITSQYLRYDRVWRASPRASLADLVNAKPPVGHPESGPDLAKAIKTLPRARRRLLAHIGQATNLDQLWEESQRKQTVIIASDGGLKGCQGTCGWVISTKANGILAEGAGPVDGPYDSANSTRCELGGYAASLIFLSLLHTLWGVRYKCKFRWVTDSRTAITNVSKVQERTYRKKRQPSNADYLGIIQSETTNLRRRITPVWVKGHQNKSMGQSIDSKLNNRADSLATWYRNQQNYRQSVEHTDHSPESKVSISVNGVRIVSQVEATLRFHINGYHLRQYIQSRQRWSNKTWDRIDFELFGRFYRKLNTRAQVAHTKFIYDQWHTGKKRERVSSVKDATMAQCPCCRTEVETSAHVLHCRMNPDRDLALREFRMKMTPTEYHPIFTLLKEGIVAWFEDHEYEPDQTVFPRKMRDTIHTALCDQAIIGWGNAVKGYLSVEWRYLAELDTYDNVKEKPLGVGFSTLNSILCHVHHLTQRLWKSRNEDLHKSDDQALKDIRDSETREIRDMYDHPERLQAGDRHNCDQPIESILKKSPATRRRWLQYTRMSRARMLKDGQRQLLLTQFFRPADTVPMASASTTGQEH